MVPTQPAQTGPSRVLNEAVSYASCLKHRPRVVVVDLARRSPSGVGCAVRTISRVVRMARATHVNFTAFGCITAPAAVRRRGRNFGII